MRSSYFCWEKITRQQRRKKGKGRVKDGGDKSETVRRKRIKKNVSGIF
jgi:hypothetical protein